MRILKYYRIIFIHSYTQKYNNIWILMLFEVTKITLIFISFDDLNITLKLVLRKAVKMLLWLSRYGNIERFWAWNILFPDVTNLFNEIRLSHLKVSKSITTKMIFSFVLQIYVLSNPITNHGELISTLLKSVHKACPKPISFQTALQTLCKFPQQQDIDDTT